MNALTDSRTVIRASSLPVYADCPRRWAARHLRREIEAAGHALRDLPGGVGAFVGTSVHAGAGHMLTEKMTQGRLPVDPRDSVDLAVATFDPLIEDGVIWDATTGSLNDAHRQIVRMVRAYWLERAPHVEPVEIEQRMARGYPGDPGIILSGQGDVFEDGAIDDLKTGTGRRASTAQYGAYSLLRRSAGHDVTRITETHVPRARSMRPPARRRRQSVTPPPSGTPGPGWKGWKPGRPTPRMRRPPSRRRARRWTPPGPRSTPSAAGARPATCTARSPALPRRCPS